MNYTQKKDLLKRFRNRQLLPVEQELFYNLIKDGKYKKEFAKILEEIEAEVKGEQITNVDPASLLNIKTKLKQQIVNNNRKNWLTIKAMAIAASLLLTLGAGWGYYSLQQFNKTQHYITVNVPLGKIYQLKLEDGTIIKLVSGSSFKYPEAFEKKHRHVYLIKGKALFNVAHDSNRPFTVKSGELSTTALGTSFTVQYNKSYNWEKVNLFTGKVVIEHDPNGRNGTSGPTFLTPGQAYEISGVTDKKSRIEQFKPGSDPIANGALNFVSTPFEEAIYQIASYYQIHIYFNAADLKKHKVNGEFKNQSADEVLKTLTQIYHLSSKKTSDTTYAIIRTTNK